jgi:SNF2 family DNA or RNA helicase
VENKPEDLFSIMEFVDPDVLGRFDIFDRTFIVRDWYGRPTRYRNLKLLRQRMAEAMVRKSRKDIEDQLPRVVETMIPVTITRAEARLYNIISNQLLAKMAEAVDQFGGSFSLTANYGRDDNHVMMQAQGKIMSMMLALRLVCGDVQLLVDSAHHFNDPKRSDGSQYAADLLADGLLDNVPKSTKHDELVELLSTIFEEDPASKVVVFSTFKGVLREIKKRTAHLSESVIYDGDMSAKQKDAAKMTFQSNPDCRLFLSSDAGGYGVNLSEANYLISFDLPWSTGKFEQRESRIIRISTEFEHVTLIDLVVRGSLEQRIHDMLTQKKGVADAFIDGGFDSKGRFEMTLSSLTAFLQENSP